MRLAALVAALERCVARGDVDGMAALVASVELDGSELEALVEERADGYAHRRVARTDGLEVLVLTWLVGQGSAPHDHGGSACAMRVVRGAAEETRFRLGRDGLVEPTSSRVAAAGEVLFHRAREIHAVANRGPGTLVTLNAYAPPLPDSRRYAPRRASSIAPVFTRRASGPTVAIVGGGFSGTLVAANLVRRATAAKRALHVVVVERGAALGEGAAYRTAAPQHVLNVPAGKMSAWPDRPDDFLTWARARDPSVQATDFLPRGLYAEYVRETLATAAREATGGIGVEIRQADVRAIDARVRGFRLATADADTIAADAVVLATGHRPPDDVLGSRWHGPRARYLRDPWAQLALDAICDDEPILLLGTGLTAVDVAAALGPRTPIVAISRRGLLPAVHGPAASDPGEWIRPLLAQRRLTARALVGAVRARARAGDWRAVVDGLRAYTPAIWRALSDGERARWLRHARPFWDAHRHRMAPLVDEPLRRRLEDGALRVVAGRVLAARASESGVDVEIAHRGASVVETLRVAWVVNCTGPGAGPGALVESLVAAGHLQRDELGLGVLTGPRGEALAARGPRADLVVVGPLRRAQLWESTAVPELRVQAAEAAAAILDGLFPGG